MSYQEQKLDFSFRTKNIKSVAFPEKEGGTALSFAGHLNVPCKLPSRATQRRHLHIALTMRNGFNSEKEGQFTWHTETPYKF